MVRYMEYCFTLLIVIECTVMNTHANDLTCMYHCSTKRNVPIYVLIMVAIVTIINVNYSLISVLEYTDALDAPERNYLVPPVPLGASGMHTPE